MLHLHIHEDAQRDIDALWETNEDAAATIITTLEEIQANPDTLDILTIHKFGNDRNVDEISIGKWQQLWRQGKDLWRLKIWELEHGQDRWRVIYAYIVHEQAFYVLGVVPRSFNYDPDHILSQRIIRAYNDLS